MTDASVRHESTESFVGRVLVIDDDAGVAATVRDALSELGYMVRTASGGAEALALMPEYAPDVVLLDIIMPGMSDDAVLQRLRARYPEIPVIMVTAINDADRARGLLCCGAFDYMPKPFDLTKLVRLVEAAVGARHWYAAPQVTV